MVKIEGIPLFGRRDITVSASTSDTYKPHAVGKVVNIGAEEKVKKNGVTCKLDSLEFTPLSCTFVVSSTVMI